MFDLVVHMLLFKVHGACDTQEHTEQHKVHLADTHCALVGFHMAQPVM